MKNLFNFAFTVTATAMLAIAGCSSTKDDPTPAATTGAINGTVSPAGSITTVTATSASGQTATATPAATTGTYAFASLAAGTYALSFAPATGYTAPAARPGLVVAAGQTTAAGTTTVSPTNTGGAAGSFTWSEGGAAKSGVVQNHTLQAGGSASVFTLTLTGATATGGSITNNDLVTLSLLNVSGPGTYNLGISAAGVLASATFNRNRVGSPTAIWGCGPGLAGGQGSGSITLTSFNPTARTAAGTFTFTGGPVTNTGTVNTVAVTSGAFNVTIP